MTDPNLWQRYCVAEKKTMSWKDFIFILAVLLSTATTTAQNDSSSTEVNLPTNKNNNVSDLEDDTFPPDLFTMEQECKKKLQLSKILNHLILMLELNKICQFLYVDFIVLSIRKRRLQI